MFCHQCHIVLTGLNLAGVRQGARTQSLLTVVEVVGLLLIIVTGLAISASPVPEAASARTLGLSEMAPSDAVAADVMGRAYGA